MLDNIREAMRKEKLFRYLMYYAISGIIVAMLNTIGVFLGVISIRLGMIILLIDGLCGLGITGTIYLHYLEERQNMEIYGLLTMTCEAIKMMKEKEKEIPDDKKE